MLFTLILEVPVLSIRRVPVLLALFVLASLASACERNPAAAEEQQRGEYCEENPTHC